MGVHISTRNESIQFNWSGAEGINDWSKKHLKMNAFVGWDGGNGTTVVFNRDPNKEREVKGDPKQLILWVKRFQEYHGKIGDSVLDSGKGTLVSEVAYRTYQHAYSTLAEEHGLKASLFEGDKKEIARKDFTYIQAIGWYFLLIDAFECGYINYM